MLIASGILPSGIIAKMGELAWCPGVVNMVATTRFGKNDHNDHFPFVTGAQRFY